MSAYHFNSSGEPDNRFLSDDEWLEVCDEWPVLLEWLKRPRRISYDYDIPFLGGISTNGACVFIDRRYKPILSWRNHRGSVTMDSSLTIPDHEITEYYAIRFIGLHYDPENPKRSAHVLGNTAERLAVQACGCDWDEYNYAIDHQLQPIEMENVTKCPRDLCLYPYQESKSLLAKIQAAQHA